MYFVLEVSVAPVGAVLYFCIIDCGLWFKSSRCHDFSMWELLFYFMNCELFLEYYLVNSYIGPCGISYGLFLLLVFAVTLLFFQAIFFGRIHFEKSAPQVPLVIGETFGEDKTRDLGTARLVELLPPK